MLRRMTALAALLIVIVGCGGGATVTRLPAVWPKMLERPSWNMTEKVGHTALVYVELIEAQIEEPSTEEKKMLSTDPAAQKPEENLTSIDALTDHLVQALRSHGVRATRDPEFEGIEYRLDCHSRNLNIVTSEHYPYDKHFKADLRCTLYDDGQRIDTYSAEAHHQGHLVAEHEAEVLGIGNTDYYVLLKKTILPVWDEMAGRVRIGLR